MKVKILSPTPDSPYQYLTTYVVNDAVAIDAGCLGLAGSPAQQSSIRHVFLTHIHLDHVLSLPIFVQNAADGAADPVVAYGSQEMLGDLRRDVFSGRLWPRYPLNDGPGGPRLVLVPLEIEKAVRAAGLRITPVLVSHVNTTLGYLVDDGESLVAFGADSGPTERIWEIARRMERWKGAFIETTFPNELGDLADRTGHLTPALLRREVERLSPGVRVIAVHLAPPHRERIAAELADLRDSRITVGVPGREYEF